MKFGKREIPELLLSCLIFTCLNGHFAFGRGLDPCKVEAYLDAAHRLWQFDGVVLIAHEGKVLFRQAYGMANQVFADTNTLDTRFFIGSITKQFTAAAIMALQDEELLKIEDSITRYLPDYPSDPGDRITILHLLTHTSGIPNYTDDLDLILHRTQPITPEEILDRFKNKAVEFEPGTQFRYSNSGYVLLGLIIEKVSGQSYEAYLNHRILKPAGMLKSGYGRREASIPDRADGYTIEGNATVVDALPVNFSVLFSAGALYSTANDMAMWDKALYGGRVLSKSAIAAMLTPHLGNYGFGWIIENRYGRRHAYHGGFLDGFSTVFDRWIDDRLCVVVFSNEDESPVSKIANGLAAIAFNKPYVMPIKKTALSVEPDSLREYEGVYRSDDGQYRFVKMEQDTLLTYLRGMSRKVLLQQAPDTFFFASDNTSILVFRRGVNNEIASVDAIDDNVHVTGKRLSKADSQLLVISREIIAVDSSRLERYVGEYEIENEFGARGFFLEVDNHGNHLMITIVGGESIEISPSSENCFFHQQADFQITFLLDDQDTAIGCLIQMGGITVHGLKTK